MQEIIEKAKLYIHNELHTSKRLSKGNDSAKVEAIRLSDEVVKGIPLLPDKLPSFINNAVVVWKECGCPWFYSSKRRRGIQKGANIRRSTFVGLESEMARQRISSAIFTEEIVYQYLNGASKELKEVIDRLRDMYTDDEEMWCFITRVTRSIDQQLSVKANHEMLIKGHVIGHLIRAWMECGAPKVDAMVDGPTVSMRVSMPKALIEPFEQKCSEVHISKRKLIDSLLSAWLHS